MMKKLTVLIVLCSLFLTGIVSSQVVNDVDYSIEPSSTIIFFGERLYFNITADPDMYIWIEVLNENGTVYRSYQVLTDENGTKDFRVSDFANYEPGNYTVMMTEYGTERYLSMTYFLMIYDKNALQDMNIAENTETSNYALRLAMANEQNIERIDELFGQMRLVMIAIVFFVSGTTILFINVFEPQITDYFKRTALFRFVPFWFDVDKAEEIHEDGDYNPSNDTIADIDYIFEQDRKKMVDRLKEERPDIIENHEEFLKEVDRQRRYHSKRRIAKSLVNVVTLKDSHGKRTYEENVKKEDKIAKDREEKKRLKEIKKSKKEEKKKENKKYKGDSEYSRKKEEKRTAKADKKKAKKQEKKDKIDRMIREGG